MKTHARNHQAGFTLIEYIVALVIAAIVMAMVSTFFGSALTQSGVPIKRFQNTSNLNQVMENIVADYNRLNRLNLRYIWKVSTAYSVNSFVVPPSNNGHYYKCTTAGSNTMEPDWKTTSGGVTTVAGAIWTESGRVWKASTSYPANTIVVPYYNNGHYYKGTTSPDPFISGTSEPIWPTAIGSAPISDGDVLWMEAGTALYNNEGIENLFTLLPNVNATNTRYGTGYTVTEKVFIRFVPTSTPPNQEDSLGVTENNILKVTIKNNDSAETLTQLFTIR